jgi:nucleoside-diphosphate-sugar epimerase
MDHPTADGIAITGGTGFIGRHLVGALKPLVGRMKVLTRREVSPTTERPGARVELIRGDLSDREALDRLVDGCDTLLHLAGAVRSSSPEDFDTVNVDGTGRLAEAALGSGTVRRVLHVSSLAAREPRLSWYSGSKRRGEERMSDVLRGRIELTVLRPTAVYGPGDAEMRPVFRTLKKGWVPGLSGASRMTLLHVFDLVEAIRLWVTSAESPPGLFECHDGRVEGYGWADLAEIAERVWGRRVRQVPVPGPVLRAVATVNLVASRMIGRAPMLTPSKVHELRHPDWRCDNGPLNDALGWSPEIDLETSLRRGIHS